jgi:hypothetical protein
MHQSGDDATRRGERHDGIGRYRADRVLAGQGLADHRGGEGRGGSVRAARPHDNGRQAHRTAVDKAFAAVIVDQQFADRLLGAVGGLRRQRGVVADRRRQRAAIDRQRAGEDEARRGAQGAAGVEHSAGPVEIDAVAEIGVGLGLAADDGGEMKHRIGAGCNDARHRLAVGDVAGDERQTLVIRQRQRRGRVVEQCQLVDRPERRTFRQQLQRHPPAEKAAPAGDHDAHVAHSR